MSKREPSNLEMQVLALLWQRGPSTVRDVQDALPDGKTRAYTTVLTVLQVMEKKGLVTHTSQGNAHVYEAKVSKRQALGPVMRSLVRHIFGGSPANVLQHLLTDGDLSRAELDKIKDVIREHEKSSDTARKKKTP